MTDAPPTRKRGYSRRTTLAGALRAFAGSAAIAALAELRQPAPAAADEWCQCVGYLKRAGLLEGGPCWARDYRSAPGYERSRRPRKGWVMVIQPGILGVPASTGSYWLTDGVFCDGSAGAGHVALVTAVTAPRKQSNPTWTVRVRHANWSSTSRFSSHGCSNVSSTTFTIPRDYLANGWVTFICPRA